MKKKRKIVALVYDFDGTLAPGNMQEYSFIKAVGNETEEFWAEANEIATNNDCDNVLAYMFLMLAKARGKKFPINKSSLRKYGNGIEFFKGVSSWFERINAFGKSEDVEVEHYINSSGMKEIIEGTGISDKFKAIFASSYIYDEKGNAMWPAAAVNYTNKTQFLFKINKGIFSISDSVKINESVPEDRKRVAFNNMIYFGDGETDVPCMKLVKQLGGTSIGVFDPGNETKREIARKLFKQDRVNFISPADYSEDSPLEKLVMALIRKMKADMDLGDIRKNIKF